MKKHSSSSGLQVFFATWFYTGFLPPIIFKKMAGTYGSFFSLPLCVWALYRAEQTDSWEMYLAYVAAVFILGLLFVSDAEKAIGPRVDYKGRVKNRDQNEIVIDETLGMLLTCWPFMYMPVELFTGQAVILLGLGFLYFRFFDIVKIPPTKFFDRLPNAFGVMMDDGIAAAYAAACLWATYIVFF
jgi:phosphatidylglycerophosphatase A